MALVFRNQKMANVIDFRFKVKNELDDDIFSIKIAWQTSVKDAIPTIKEEMATRNKQVPDDIKLYVDNPKGPAKALEQDDMISKHFNIDHIEEGLILIYLTPLKPNNSITFLFLSLVLSSNNFHGC
ncbi:hypothetical protein RclHR1_08070005 [Rhizophagus clarus]|uniref:Ubiquitin-like domain-containing protein n=1 Tax=Rhizophagus clarus TaxID=94130 RepID=A0A2Z6S1K7_9GLOM|nr:hypothetical protein RclHR1_08070005 [Rhizophagus clarus]